MSPKKSKNASKTEKVMDNSPPDADFEKDANETTNSESSVAAAEDVPSVSSRPGAATAPKNMELRRTPCLACVEHLMSWMPSDLGVMYCQEGTTTSTCARCEYAGIECQSTTGVLKKPATNLQTTLSKTIRDTESVKHLQKSVRSKLKAERISSCETNRDWVADELCEKMEPFFESLRRSSRLEGFQSAMDLAIEAVKGCKGGCHCLLRGCTLGSKAAIAVAQGEGGGESWLDSFGMKIADGGKMVCPDGDKGASKSETGKKQKAAKV